MDTTAHPDHVGPGHHQELREKNGKRVIACQCGVDLVAPVSVPTPFFPPRDDDEPKKRGR